MSTGSPPSGDKPRPNELVVRGRDSQRDVLDSGRTTPAARAHAARWAIAVAVGFWVAVAASGPIGVAWVGLLIGTVVTGLVAGAKDLRGWLWAVVFTFLAWFLVVLFVVTFMPFLGY